MHNMRLYSRMSKNNHSFKNKETGPYNCKYQKPFQPFKGLCKKKIQTATTPK